MGMGTGFGMVQKPNLSDRRYCGIGQKEFEETGKGGQMLFMGEGGRIRQVRLHNINHKIVITGTQGEMLEGGRGTKQDKSLIKAISLTLGFFTRPRNTNWVGGGRIEYLYRVKKGGGHTKRYFDPMVLGSKSSRPGDSKRKGNRRFF